MKIQMLGTVNRYTDKAGKLRARVAEIIPDAGGDYQVLDGVEKLPQEGIANIQGRFVTRTYVKDGKPGTFTGIIIESASGIAMAELAKLAK
jgi:hypothetical protein